MLRLVCCCAARAVSPAACVIHSLLLVPFLMKAPLPSVRFVPPQWVRTSTTSGAFLAMTTSDSLPPAFLPPATPASTEPGPPAPAPPAGVVPDSPNEPPPLAFTPLPPSPPEQFPLVRSEDGRVALTNEGLELEGELFGWRELEGVEVRAVRWLLGVLLGAFTFCVFTLGFLQYWLRSMPAALGMGAGVALVAWGARGTNRWRLYRPGQEPRHFAFAGAARSWQQLAQEANRRIRQRHDEAAATAAYWLHTTAALTPPPVVTGSND